MKKEIIRIRLGYKKMSVEELEVYLREKSRGCGAHDMLSRKTVRLKNKQQIRKGGGDDDE